MYSQPIAHSLVNSWRNLARCNRAASPAIKMRSLALTWRFWWLCSLVTHHMLAPSVPSLFTLRAICTHVPMCKSTCLCVCLQLNKSQHNSAWTVFYTGTQKCEDSKSKSAVFIVNHRILLISKKSNSECHRPRTYKLSVAVQYVIVSALNYDQIIFSFRCSLVQLCFIPFWLDEIMFKKCIKQ